MVTINPGSGSVPEATVEHAERNVIALMDDVMSLLPVKTTVTRAPDKDRNGRFGFVVTVGWRAHTIQMPGLALDEVRFLALEDQNIYDFPRIYVDGSSWLWKYALGVITGEH